MIGVICSRRAGGRSGPGLRGWFLLARLRFAGRSGGGASTVIWTWPMVVACRGRPPSRARQREAGAFDLAGAVPRPPGREQGVQDGAADPADAGGIAAVRLAAGRDELLAGGRQGG